MKYYFLLIAFLSGVLVISCNPTHNTPDSVLKIKRILYLDTMQTGATASNNDTSISISFNYDGMDRVNYVEIYYGNTQDLIKLKYHYENSSTQYPFQSTAMRTKINMYDPQITMYDTSKLVFNPATGDKLYDSTFQFVSLAYTPSIGQTDTVIKKFTFYTNDSIQYNYDNTDPYGNFTHLVDRGLYRRVENQNITKQASMYRYFETIYRLDVLPPSSLSLILNMEQIFTYDTKHNPLHKKLFVDPILVPWDFLTYTSPNNLTSFTLPYWGQVPTGFNHSITYSYNSLDYPTTGIVSYDFGNGVWYMQNWTINKITYEYY